MIRVNTICPLHVSERMAVRSTYLPLVTERRKDISQKISQINSMLNGPGAEYERENLPYAKPMADTPDLCWKVWIINDDQMEAGGMYLFDNKAATQAFVDGQLEPN